MNLLLAIKILGFTGFGKRVSIKTMGFYWERFGAPKERIGHFLRQANDGSLGSSGDMNFLNGMHPALASCLRAAISDPSATDRNDPPRLFFGLFTQNIFFQELQRKA